MLTNEELKTLPWNAVSISDTTIIANHQILEIGGKFYSAHGNGIFPNRYDQQTRAYQKTGNMILFELNEGNFTRIVPADILKSKVNDFNGFDTGKLFELENGQVWKQTDTLSSPCSPGGTVWIFNHSVIRVGNWNFDVAVKQVK